MIKLKDPSSELNGILFEPLSSSESSPLTFKKQPIPYCSLHIKDLIKIANRNFKIC